MIIGSMVIFNEMDRYLQASLTRMLEVCDKVFVADDRSTDGSAELAKEMGCEVWVRPSYRFSFMENEGQFREDAWNAMQVLEPSTEDWILSMDSDEYFAGHFPDLKNAESPCFSIYRHEIWAQDPYRVRTDVFWAMDYPRRIARWNPGQKFLDVPMGCGSVPFQKSERLARSNTILHFGFMTEEDRVKKYNRYKSLKNHGHNEKHIDSIITQPTLQGIDLTGIDFWRGVK